MGDETGSGRPRRRVDGACRHMALVMQGASFFRKEKVGFQQKLQPR